LLDGVLQTLNLGTDEKFQILQTFIQSLCLNLQNF